MDVARAPQKRTFRNVMIGISMLAGVALFTWLSTLQKAAPIGDMAVVIQDSVRQGDMIREVRGPAPLVPEQIQQATAPATARVDRMIAQSRQGEGGGPGPRIAGGVP